MPRTIHAHFPDSLLDRIDLAVLDSPQSSRTAWLVKALQELTFDECEGIGENNNHVTIAVEHPLAEKVEDFAKHLKISIAEVIRRAVTKKLSR